MSRNTSSSGEENLSSSSMPSSSPSPSPSPASSFCLHHENEPQHQHKIIRDLQEQLLHSQKEFQEIRIQNERDAHNNANLIFSLYQELETYKSKIETLEGENEQLSQSLKEAERNHNVLQKQQQQQKQQEKKKFQQENLELKEEIELLKRDLLLATQNQAQADNTTNDIQQSPPPPPHDYTSSDDGFETEEEASTPQLLPSRLHFSETQGTQDRNMAELDRPRIPQHSNVSSTVPSIHCTENSPEAGTSGSHLKSLVSSAVPLRHNRAMQRSRNRARRQTEADEALKEQLRQQRQKQPSTPPQPQRFSTESRTQSLPPCSPGTSLATPRITLEFREPSSMMLSNTPSSQVCRAQSLPIPLAPPSTPPSLPPQDTNQKMTSQNPSVSKPGTAQFVPGRGEGSLPAWATRLEPNRMLTINECHGQHRFEFMKENEGSSQLPVAELISAIMSEGSADNQDDKEYVLRKDLRKDIQKYLSAHLLVDEDTKHFVPKRSNSDLSEQSVSDIMDAYVRWRAESLRSLDCVQVDLGEKGSGLKVLGKIFMAPKMLSNHTRSGISKVGKKVSKAVVTKVASPVIAGTSKVASKTLSGISKVADSAFSGSAKVASMTVSGTSKVASKTVSGVTKVTGWAKRKNSVAVISPEVSGEDETWDEDGDVHSV